MQAAVIQTAFLGDVILTTPFIKYLQDQLDFKEIHFITTKVGAEALEGLPNVHCYILNKSKFWRGIKEIEVALEEKQINSLFSVHRSIRSLILGQRISSKRKIAFSSIWSKCLNYETAPYPEYQEGLHYFMKPFSLVNDLYTDIDFSKIQRLRPVLHVSEGAEKSIIDKLKNISGKSYIVISPFSNWGTKMWFSDRFARLGVELYKKYQTPIVVAGPTGEVERVVAQTIAQKINHSGGKSISLVGNTNLGELKALIKNASLLVANDSAPVHIASAFNTPTVAIFGPTVKKWGFFPLAQDSIIVERQNIDCRPCSLHGPQKCPKRHFRCMDEIEVTDVLSAVQNLNRIKAH